MSKFLKIFLQIILIFFLNDSNNNLLKNLINYNNNNNNNNNKILVECGIVKWNNDTNNLDFNDPFGWSTNMVPSEDDDAIIDIEDIVVFSVLGKVQVNSLLLGNKVSFGSIEEFHAKYNITINENSKMISFSTSAPNIHNYGQYYGTQVGSQIKNSVLNSYDKSKTIFLNQNNSTPLLNTIANIYNYSNLNFSLSSINLPNNSTINLFNNSTCIFYKTQSNFCNFNLRDTSNFYALEGDYILSSNTLFQLNDGSNFYLKKSNLSINGYLIGNISSTLDFEILQSSITINQGGNFVTKSRIQCRDSTFTINENGALSLTYGGGEIVLRNTIFKNQKGSVFQQGNIYLNSGSLIENNGIFNISSTIYSSGDKNTVLKNNGTIFIKSNDLLKIESPVINYGKIVIDFKQSLYLTNYNQKNGSMFNLQDGSFLDSNLPLQIDGGMFFGNATFNTSIIHNYGYLGSYNDTCYIYVNGDYTMGQYGIIVVLINSIEDYTQIFIKETAVLRGDLEVKISNKISSKNLKQLEVVNFRELDKFSNAFKKVRFKTFDPDTGEEKDGNDCAQSIQTDKTFSVLFRDCESPLSNGVIIGFCVGLVGTATLVGVVYHYRKKIKFFLKNNKIKKNDEENYNNGDNNNINDNSDSYNNNNNISLDIISDNSNITATTTTTPTTTTTTTITTNSFNMENNNGVNIYNDNTNNNNLINSDNINNQPPFSSSLAQ